MRARQAWAATGNHWTPARHRERIETTGERCAVCAGAIIATINPWSGATYHCDGCQRPTTAQGEPLTITIDADGVPF